MTRKKKTRKTGPLAPAKKPREEQQRKAPETTRKHKGKGKRPGSRFNVERPAQRSSSGSSAAQDPRKGSKKPIQLVSAAATTATTVSQSAFNRAAAEAELQALENDVRLQQLLAAIEAGTDLTAEEEAYVDERTERFEQLAQQLGLSLDGDYEDDDWEDDDD
ncbi:Der GTPase-activating protein YihI [Pseudidiomarina insulisalsae]|uniref:Der GTPase-activating protein YihI n=1 Tax=Pseudidiomarina insulisalsae TaxID=575789 RepID=A0A432YQC1_9GAMM|nr:Der GTPase-activating protein YihI [Pseudidiomarina insulisalsae]RUO63174.1 hypothetical protein CWI71_02820 [Pseudidiomarina insulisalsae]